MTTPPLLGVCPPSRLTRLRSRIERTTGTLFGSWRMSQPDKITHPHLHIGRWGPVQLGYLGFQDKRIGVTLAVGKRAVYVGRHDWKAPDA